MAQTRNPMPTKPADPSPHERLGETVDVEQQPSPVVVTEMARQTTGPSSARDARTDPVEAAATAEAAAAADRTTTRLTFETIDSAQADTSLAGYRPVAEGNWRALLAPGLSTGRLLTDEERGLIAEAALAAAREGRVLVVDLAMPASS